MFYDYDHWFWYYSGFSVVRVDVSWLWPLIFVLFCFQCGTGGCFVIITTDFCTILFSVRYGWMFCDYDHWFLYYSGFSAVQVDVSWLWPLIFVLFCFQCGTGGCFMIMTTDFCTILFSVRYGWMFYDYDHWFLYSSGFSAVRVDVLWLWPLIFVLFCFQCGTGGCFMIMTTDFCTILFSVRYGWMFYDYDHWFLYSSGFSAVRVDVLWLWPLIFVLFCFQCGTGGCFVIITTDFCTPLVSVRYGWMFYDYDHWFLYYSVFSAVRVDVLWLWPLIFVLFCFQCGTGGCFMIMTTDFCTILFSVRYGWMFYDYDHWFLYSSGFSAVRVDVLWLWPLIFVLLWFQCGTGRCFVIMTTDFCTLLVSVRYRWMFRDYDHWFLYFSGFSAVRVDVLWLFTGGCPMILTTDFCTFLVSVRYGWMFYWTSPAIGCHHGG